MKKILVHGGSLVTAKNVQRADVLVSVTGEIENVRSTIQSPKGAETVDATGLLLFPLLIDCHVHFREPGLTQKATMETEARAALAGGIGTVCEMPNTIPPTTTIAALEEKVRLASMTDGCTIKFFFGVTDNTHLTALKELWTGTSPSLKRLKHHCCGIKLYLDHSTGDQRVDEGIVADVFRTCAELKIPLVVHCEDPDVNAAAAKKNTRTDIAAHGLLRPPESEARALERMLVFVRKYRTPLHIAHLSTKQGATLIREAKREGLPLTCEVTPHHLFFTTDDYATLGTLIKVNPPVGSVEHRNALWEALLDKTIDCVASDHAPHLLTEKKAGEPLKAPSGVPGNELMIPLLLTAAAGRWPHPTSVPPPAFTLSHCDIVRLCFENPNRIFSLGAEEIRKGARARFVLVDPKACWIVTPVTLKSKCGWTPYEAWELQGNVMRVMHG
jgi:dihydroorotase